MKTDARAATARVDRRTKDLVKRIEPGEIAVIDHRDIDRVAAESLIRAGVAAVVNAAQSISGRYPNRGPLLIVEAGIPLIDEVGPELLWLVTDGDALRIDGEQLWLDDRLVGKGVLRTAAELAEKLELARANIGVELKRFARNTLEYIDREADLTFEPLVLPDLPLPLRGRHALVVVRGYDYETDLTALRPYIREFRPVLIAVDGGADALLERGLRPDIIIGDFDSLSQRALHAGATLVHHVHPDGRAPGRENLVEWGVPYQEFVAAGTSEDVAMLLAYEAGAQLIVAVGTHATMVEFLDKGRAGMASTFLTRLRLGPVLVDAKGVNRLYESRVRRRDLLLLVVAALVAMVAMVVASESARVFVHGFWFTVNDLWHSIRDAL
jgi:uncharacterized membrane-anchored protein